ncbi:MAG: winged helix-turn-helix domain-containing protein [Acidobacteriota bacterium]
MSPEVETRAASDGPFRIGEWLVEPRLNRLTRGGESIQLELKVMDVLLCLVEHAGELVERQRIIDRVWATEYITDATTQGIPPTSRTSRGVGTGWWPR